MQRLREQVLAELERVGCERMAQVVDGHNYGTTKQGTYMCEANAKVAGERVAENEKHP